MSQYSVVVTGAASGIGRAALERFVSERWTVIAVDRDEASLAAMDCEFVVPRVADVRDGNAFQAAIDSAVGSAPPLRSVIHVAGIFPPTTFDSWSPELYREIFDVNVLGTVNVARTVVPKLRAVGDGGAIVNMVAGNAFTPAPKQFLYAASKAAVISLTRSLAATLASENILVNGIAPGWVDTPGNERTGRMVGMAAQIPLGRVAAAAEIAEWSWRLGGSDPAPYMTGETILVTGGLIMR